MKKGLKKELNEVLHRMNFDPSKSLTEGFMSKYEKGVKQLTEAIEYDDEHRIHPDIEGKLRDRGHHLGDHPSFPASDDHHFEEKVASKRFKAGSPNNFSSPFSVAVEGQKPLSPHGRG